MFERLGTLTFMSSGWFTKEFTECHIYLDGNRILLKCNDYIETYLCSDNDMSLNHIFIQYIIAIIKSQRKDEKVYITLQQLIVYEYKQKDQHSTALHSLILDMFPNNPKVYSYTTDPNFMYQKNNIHLICHEDYAELFL